MTITDNHGFIIGPITIKPVNEPILPQVFSDVIAFSQRVGMDLSGSALTLDSAFDSKANHQLIREHGLKPVIYPNRRNAKEPIVIARKFRWFDKEIYKTDIVERTFGGKTLTEDSPYDKLKETRLGFRGFLTRTRYEFSGPVKEGDRVIFAPGTNYGAYGFQWNPDEATFVAGSRIICISTIRIPVL